MSNYVLVLTTGFRGIEPMKQAKIITETLKKIDVEKPNFIVFDPDADKEELEDEGRTLRMPFRDIPERIYAILDDYGSPEVLSSQMGTNVDTQYTITFLLSSEY